MNKKLWLKYLFLYLPFMVGSTMYCFGSINLLSSLLLFCGGYIAIKNTIDYQRRKKYINNLKIENKNNSMKNYSYKNPENVMGFKRTRRYSKVRRRVKY